MMISIILILDLEGDGLQEKRALAQVWSGRERERGRGKTEIKINIMIMMITNFMMTMIL